MKQWMTGIVLIVSALIASSAAQTQEYPTREIRLVVGFTPGGGADIMVRFFGKQLQAVSGKTFIVENQPGAGGSLAHGYVARQRADGYLFYPVGGSGIAASVSLFKNPPVDPLKDFAYLGGILKHSWYITVDARSPYKTLQELTAALKQKGSKASYSSSSVTAQVVGELYKQIAGLETVQVQYKIVGDSLNDLLSGNIDFMVADAPYLIGQLKAGRLRALAGSGAQRSKALADIPTMAESGVPGLDIVTWWVGAVAAGVPQPAKDRLAGWLHDMLRLKETEDFFASIGADAFPLTPKESTEYISAEIKNWAGYVQRAGIEKQ